jgi:F-box and WD-40 domain protein 1/11
VLQDNTFILHLHRACPRRDDADGGCQHIDIAYEVLRTLRTSKIAAVVDRLTPLLHMDPVGKLPPEITSQIFSYLDASTLLTASLSSQAWRARILDPRLWRRLYSDQGWGLDSAAVKSYEETRTRSLRHEFRKSGTAFRASETDRGQPVQKKRATANFLDQQTKEVFSGDVSQWREQHGAIEADTDVPARTPSAEIDHEMTDVSSTDLTYPASPHRRNKRGSQESRDEMIMSPVRPQESIALPSQPSNPHVHPPMTLRDPSGNERMNWAFLYKQRRRLEDNWNKGRFTNFQLPHPAYPHEAHRECVYTIQFFGKWLVSGSRDKTLRIWDLETRRLRGPPLTGHTQSVLCLQFDPTEKEDVIISGSSDTNVIVWRFSTGQKLKEIQQAHRDPVLNLRFDHRYLITCSKDKLIKVWNRYELSPLDKDYPKVSAASTARMPSYIIDTSSMNPQQIEQKLANRQIKMLQHYSLLMALDGHNAAVNAIQIDQDQIVSASGDRLIKVWSVIDGRLLSTLPGHQKGIACVQFDSKRIVSGSSDNTVRIYDHLKKCEVAVLRGHTNLVRTVQAGFGDLPYSDQAMANQARLAEKEYRRAVAAGEIVHEPIGASRSAREQHDAIKTPAQYLTAFGAALPPGGGGSQWGRIVSGSYDETIIIWKKDADGRWIQGQTLRQEAAIRSGAAADLRAYTEDQIDAGGAPAPSNVNPLPQPSAAQIAHQTMQPSTMGLQTIGQHITGLMGQSLSTIQGLARDSAPGSHFSSMAPGAQQALAQLNAHQQNIQNHFSNLTQVTASNTGPGGPSTVTTTTQANNSPVSNIPTASVSVSQNATNGQNVANSNPPPIQAPTPQHPAAHHHHHHHVQQANQQPQLPQQPASRVFKLQFDARRIVCCSQDPRIVGWDFAAGDADIMEASQFFLGP